MKSIYVFFVLLFITTSCAFNTSQVNTEKELNSLYAQFWKLYLEKHPLDASYFGYHEYDAKLPKWELTDYTDYSKQLQIFLKKSLRFEIKDKSSKGYINKAFFEEVLSSEIQLLKYKYYYITFNYAGGFHTSISSLPEYTRFENLKDFENYLTRLSNVPEYFSRELTVARKAISAGFKLPKKSFEDYEHSISSIIVKKPEDSIFYKPLKDAKIKLPETLKQRARKIISNQVLKSYKGLMSFWENELQPSFRTSPSMAAIPNGTQLYKELIRYHLGSYQDPHKIHEIGLKEVKRIQSEMQKLISRLGKKQSIRVFATELRKNPKFFAKSKKQLLDIVKSTLKKMDKQLPKLFGKLPETPYGIREVPAHTAPKQTTAYYAPPALDGSRQGYYYVNTYRLDQRPLYEVEALSFHEAVPGHHLQIALQNEMKGLPDFRRVYGKTVFVEGWALYSESLAKEVGFYKDPYSDFGRLTYEMWRACRLVVDTGIHMKGWSRQMAIDFMTRHTALSIKNIQVEVDRYITYPAQALSYKMGQLQISKLRKSAQQSLGENFSLKDFHDEVLSDGALPLDLLNQKIKIWQQQRM